MKLRLLLLVALAAAVCAQESPTPSATPEPAAVVTPEPAATPQPSAVTDTTTTESEAALETTDPKADAPEEEESSFNFWHRIISPVVGVALVAVVLVLIFIYWKRRRQNAFVEAVHDTQAFREEI